MLVKIENALHRNPNLIFFFKTTVTQCHASNIKLSFSHTNTTISSRKALCSTSYLEMTQSSAIIHNLHSSKWNRPYSRLYRFVLLRTSEQIQTESKLSKSPGRKNDLRAWWPDSNGGHRTPIGVKAVEGDHSLAQARHNLVLFYRYFGHHVAVYNVILIMLQNGTTLSSFGMKEKVSLVFSGCAVRVY